ncbi:putative selection and upkeep of intraepithelial T-cells protein 1 homolog isoform X2 [Cervus canadensis]|uniref:putative selection and upkeep of intraepithelial T-cells protein 1 homolog isoform X2 n=1 Tax=Cervus canadensis TaxID=1574408 RepID=UPI001C9E65AD|nr:putative selection and upkeep of intraepithelial T-cells protein 1 homolog isoform X2 [Cervus canadensis]
MQLIPGVMELAFSYVSGYSVAILLLQMVVLPSEQFTVSSSGSHQVALVGGHAEFSCQLSPPQSAEHMEVGWFHEHYSQLVYLYKDGEEVSGKSTYNYMNRTVLLKDSLGEGKVTLRIHDISVLDGGQYHCFFKDGDTSEEAIMDLRVAALGLDVQINVQVPDTKGLMLECNSGGWFPSPQMEWRDSRGNVIPYSSKFSSVDEAGLLHLKMSVLLKNSTHSPVTCCICNPVTGQEKRAGVILPDILFKSKCAGMLCENLYILIYLIILLALLCFSMNCILSRKVSQNRWCVLFSDCIPFLIHAGISPIYLIFKNGDTGREDPQGRSSLTSPWNSSFT